MTKEQIEKAATEYADRNWPNGRFNCTSEVSFMMGANWRINSVWHDSSVREAPDVNTIVLVEKEDGSIWQYKVFAKSQMPGWKRWAYIKDLIPNE